MKEGPTSVRPHAPYTVIPKDELLNIKVAPDSDSIPTDEPEPPDPVAAAKIYNVRWVDGHNTGNKAKSEFQYRRL